VRCRASPPRVPVNLCGMARTRSVTSAARGMYTLVVFVSITATCVLAATSTPSTSPSAVPTAATTSAQHWCGVRCSKFDICVGRDRTYVTNATGITRFDNARCWNSYKNPSQCAWNTTCSVYFVNGTKDQDASDAVCVARNPTPWIEPPYKYSNSGWMVLSQTPDICMNMSNWWGQEACPIVCPWDPPVTQSPGGTPSAVPSSVPSRTPTTALPSAAPSRLPSATPTFVPTSAPTATTSPSVTPSATPTSATPTALPTNTPTSAPTTTVTWECGIRCGADNLCVGRTRRQTSVDAGRFDDLRCYGSTGGCKWGTSCAFIRNGTKIQSMSDDVCTSLFRNQSIAPYTTGTTVYIADRTLDTCNTTASGWPSEACGVPCGWDAPTQSPTSTPSLAPTTARPSRSPTAQPSARPTTSVPTRQPTQYPTTEPGWISDDAIFPTATDYNPPDYAAQLIAAGNPLVLSAGHRNGHALKVGMATPMAGVRDPYVPVTRCTTEKFASDGSFSLAFWWYGAPRGGSVALNTSAIPLFGQNRTEVLVGFAARENATGSATDTAGGLDGAWVRTARVVNDTHTLVSVGYASGIRDSASGLLTGTDASDFVGCAYLLLANGTRVPYTTNDTRINVTSPDDCDEDTTWHHHVVSVDSTRGLDQTTYGDVWALQASPCEGSNATNDTGRIAGFNPGNNSDLTRPTQTRLWLCPLSPKSLVLAASPAYALGNTAPVVPLLRSEMLAVCTRTIAGAQNPTWAAAATGNASDLCVTLMRDHEGHFDCIVSTLSRSNRYDTDMIASICGFSRFNVTGTTWTIEAPVGADMPAVMRFPVAVDVCMDIVSDSSDLRNRKSDSLGAEINGTTAGDVLPGTLSYYDALSAEQACLARVDCECVGAVYAINSYTLFDGTVVSYEAGTYTLFADKCAAGQRPVKATRVTGRQRSRTTIDASVVFDVTITDALGPYEDDLECVDNLQPSRDQTLTEQRCMAWSGCAGVANNTIVYDDVDGPHTSTAYYQCGKGLQPAGTRYGFVREGEVLSAARRIRRPCPVVLPAGNRLFSANATIGPSQLAMYLVPAITDTRDARDTSRPDGTGRVPSVMYIVAGPAHPCRANGSSVSPLLMTSGAVCASVGGTWAGNSTNDTAICTVRLCAVTRADDARPGSASVRSGRVRSVYRDGQLVATSASAVSIQAGTTRVCIGSRYPLVATTNRTTETGPMVGFIDDLAGYPVALSADAVSAYYAREYDGSVVGEPLAQPSRCVALSTICQENGVPTRATGLPCGTNKRNIIIQAGVYNGPTDRTYTAVASYTVDGSVASTAQASLKTNGGAGAGGLGCARVRRCAAAWHGVCVGVLVTGQVSPKARARGDTVPRRLAVDDCARPAWRTSSPRTQRGAPAHWPCWSGYAAICLAQRPWTSPCHTTRTTCPCTTARIRAAPPATARWDGSPSDRHWGRARPTHSAVARVRTTFTRDRAPLPRTRRCHGTRSLPSPVQTGPCPRSSVVSRACWAVRHAPPSSAGKRSRARRRTSTWTSAPVSRRSRASTRC
jgi:hypothetical protein